MKELTPLTPIDILRTAKELIFLPHNWLKSSLAESSHPLSKGVCNKFCAVGAIGAACLPPERRTSPAIIEVLLKSDGCSPINKVRTLLSRVCATSRSRPPNQPWFNIVDFNNSYDTDHTKMMAAFDKAILLAEKEKEFSL